MFTNEDRQRWGNKLLQHWYQISADAIPGMDDPNDVDEIVEVVLDTAYDRFTTEERAEFNRNENEIRDAAFHYISRH